MNTIRVLHIVSKMDPGGIETLLMNFYKNIDRTKVQFDFLTHREEMGFYDNEIQNLGGRIYHVPPINPLKHNAYLKSLEAFFKEHIEYRIVHSHINTYSMYPLRAAMKAGIPVRIAHSHTSNVPIDLKTPFRIYTKSRLKDYSTHNFACSETAGKWLYGETAIMRENFKVINNSINVSHYIYNKKTENRMKTEMNLENKLAICHIGRFSKEKNHKFLIKVFKVIHNIHSNAVLILVGDGKLLPKVKKEVAKKGLQDSVIFTGVRSDIPELLQAMDVFVLPSIFEGLGMTAIEAQAAGLPCVVADTLPKEAFISDLIKKVSLSERPEVWANIILDCLRYKKKNTLEEVRRAGYDVVEKAKELESFYQRVSESVK